MFNDVQPNLIKMMESAVVDKAIYFRMLFFFCKQPHERAKKQQ